MNRAPRLLIALLALLALAGCRAAGTNSIAHNRPPQLAPRTAFDLDAFVAEHNANAAKIQSVEGRPSIGAQIGLPNEQTKGGRFNGRIALERPRNFKLEMSHTGTWSDVANIGSNDERFWFWLSNPEDKSVYVCNYEDLGSTSLAATFQPDWIAEALGLREITPDEKAQVKVRPGPDPETTALSFPATKAGSQGYSRLMIVSDRTRKPTEFRVFTPDGKTHLAQATIQKYHEYPVAASEDGDPSAGELCYLPEKLTLEWVREKLVLKVGFDPSFVSVNQFDPTKRTTVFVEPTPRGHARVNLAEMVRQKGLEGQTAIRETMPAPETRTKPRGNPALQIREPKETAAPSRRNSTPSAAPGAELLLPVLDLEVVGAPMPAPPEGSDPRAYTGLASSPSMTIGR